MKKEDFLSKLREALSIKSEIALSLSEDGGNLVFRLSDEDLAVAFAKEFTRKGGFMYYCTTEEELKAHIDTLQHGAAMACCNDTLTQFLQGLGFANSVTSQSGQPCALGALLCDALEAWNGGIVVSDHLGYGITMRTLPLTTIVIAFTSQIVRDWEEVDRHLQEAYPQEKPKEIALLTPSDCKNLCLILMEDQ
ncbi:MAG: hypothetical protein SPJ13_04230 [Bacteroidales bacterium]|nr:hypothetical protein [Bacteroidales bacterium]